jgi:glycosyltransferase involved in cell wall biosynthesis
MTEIIIMRSNSIIYSPRVGKIARSLRKRYSILVLGWNREGVSKEVVDNYIPKLTLFNFRAPFGRPILIAYLPLFWFWIFIRLLVYRPKVIHACDLDIVLPCYIYKAVFRRKLVFDVCDRYAMAYIPPKFKTLYSLVNRIENIFGKKADALVNVSEKLQRTFPKTPIHSVVIMNCAENHHDGMKPAIHDCENNTKNYLRLVFTGGVKRGRGLKTVLSAIKNLENVELTIAGRVADAELYNQLLLQDNVKYIGLLRPAEVLTLEADYDVGLSLYDLNDPINNFSMGNKIFEAMMLGLPIITNVATELVNETKCGIIVDYNEEKQIKAAIINLRDNLELRKMLGKNGRQAFLTKYNWKVMEQKLYEIYDELLLSKSLSEK